VLPVSLSSLRTVGDILIAVDRVVNDPAALVGSPRGRLVSRAREADMPFENEHAPMTELDVLLGAWTIAASFGGEPPRAETTFAWLGDGAR
jgi:hypothetical protein